MGVVLFDVDGTLLDSAAAYRRIWRTWSSSHALEFETVWAATHGRRPVETFAEVAPHLDPRREYAAIRALADAEGDAYQAMPGARELLSALPAGRWALVTSAPLESVVVRFRSVGLAVPDVIVDGDSVTEGKPAPEGFLRAAAHLGVPAGACLVVEDAPAGVAAGRVAGMRVLAIASTHPPEALTAADECFPTLRDAGPTIVEWCGDHARC